MTRRCGTPVRVIYAALAAVVACRQQFPPSEFTIPVILVC